MAEDNEKEKEGEWEYGIMISTEMEIGLPHIIPFRIRPAPSPKEDNPTICSICSLSIAQCECKWNGEDWVKGE